MSVPGVDDVYLALNEYLLVCSRALETTVGGLPECVYLSEGPPPWDACPCLVVWTPGPAVADTAAPGALTPGHRATVTGQVGLVAITATILRCATELSESDDLPTPAEHAAATRNTNQDVWAIWNWTREAKRVAKLFAPKEREFYQDQPIALNPEGGCCGWQITVRTELDGYRPDVSVLP